jgi:hypothetical protein
VLSILITILETCRAGRRARRTKCRRPMLPAPSCAAQKIELFRIVTGADYKDMLAFGVYAFYRLGIGPDGTWQFFVAGD